MYTTRVSDVMIPTEQYPSVSHRDTLKKALMVLEEAEKRFKGDKSWPRAVLVLNGKNRVIGKVTYWDVLRALEPQYKTMGDARTLSSNGWSPAFIKSMLHIYDLFHKPIGAACADAATKQVRDIMTPISEKELLHHEKEIVDYDRSLSEVIHLLVMSNLMALYVRKKKHIVGVVRLGDVFRIISGEIKNTE